MRVGLSRVIVATGCLLACDASFAYVDPGTGSLMIQWAFGMIVAGLAFANMYWHRFKQFISGKATRQNAAGDGSAEDGSAKKSGSD